MNSPALTPSSTLPARSRSLSWPRSAFLAAAAIPPLLTLVLYWPILNAPFVHDDYTHMRDASLATMESIAAAFGRTPPDQAGIFFRPFGFLLYWLQFKAVGPNPLAWHCASLAIHWLNSWLVWRLCRNLGLARMSAWFAALFQQLREGVTLHQFHGEIGPTVFKAAQFINRDDGRVL